MAEHSTVNRRVAGSSPAWGAIKERLIPSPLFYVFILNIHKFYLFLVSIFMCYILDMNIKSILINSDKLRSFVFPNILILYVYLQIIFLLIYSQIDKTSVYLSQTDITTGNMFNFGIIFMSVVISLFMICFCIIMTCI